MNAKFTISILIFLDSDYSIDYYDKTKKRNKVNIPSLLSIVYKYDFHKRNRGEFNADIGFTSYAKIIHHLNKIQGFCGNDIRKNFWEVNYYFGLTTSISYIFKVINNLAVGIDLQAFLFTHIEEADNYPVMIPSLRISYKY